MKRIDIKEFQREGYLQEVNRKFLHPLGLALEVIVDTETGAVELGGVWDCRDDPEGIVFAKGEIDDQKVDNVQKQWFERGVVRRRALGYIVQPPDGEWADGGKR